jgi:hypothetical protein
MAEESKHIQYSDGFHLHFTSEDREAGINEDFIINLKIPMAPKGKDHNRVAIVDAAVPKSWWLVLAPFNTFIVVEKGVQYIITVPPGNYTILQWVSQIPALLTANSLANGNSWVYTAQQNLVPQTGLITYFVTGNGGLQPSFILSPVNETNADDDANMGQQIGFGAGTFAFTGNKLLGQIVYNATGEFGVRILSDICQIENNDTLADIMDVGLSAPGSIIRFQAQQGKLQTKRFVRDSTTAFRFKLIYSTTGRIVNLNGLPWMAHLKIWREEDADIDTLKQLLLETRKQNAILTQLLPQSAATAATADQQGAEANAEATGLPMPSEEKVPPVPVPAVEAQAPTELPAPSEVDTTNPDTKHDPRAGEEPTTDEESEAILASLPETTTNVRKGEGHAKVHEPDSDEDFEHV